MLDDGVKCIPMNCMAYGMLRCGCVDVGNAANGQCAFDSNDLSQSLSQIALEKKRYKSYHTTMSKTEISKRLSIFI